MDVPRNDGKTRPDALEALDQSWTVYPSDLSAHRASFYRLPLSVALPSATLAKLLIVNLRVRTQQRQDTISHHFATLRTSRVVLK